MKLYSEAPHASIKMDDDQTLKDQIQLCLSKYKIDVAIETGTFEGTGSTKMISELFLLVQRPKVYISFEVSFQNWLTACKNLKNYPFVTCLWGCSVDRKKAAEFVKTDSVILNHLQYPNIYIDDINEPAEFYFRELMGMLGRPANYPQKTNLVHKFLNLITYKKIQNNSDPIETISREYLWKGEDLLKTYLDIHKKNNPFVILDSAGGCGWFEFKTLMEIMDENPFLLLLDDTHHLKHFRSLEHVKNNKDFSLIAHSPLHGWALAWHEKR